jgi:DNA polymerase-3 subunit alpha
LQLCGQDFTGDFAARLQQSLAADAGRGCPLWIEYRGHGATARVVLGQEWYIDPNDDCLVRLKQTFGADQVRVLYSDRRAASAGRPVLVST